MLCSRLRKANLKLITILLQKLRKMPRRSYEKRYADFRAALGIASDVLADRLRTLVDAGVMEKRSYREPGQRARESYHLTESGRRLDLVLAAMQQWGDAYVPSAYPPTVAFVTNEGHPVHVSFVDANGTTVSQDQVRLERTAPHPVR